MAVIRTGDSAFVHVPIGVRIKQVQAALFLPILTYIAFVTVRILHGIFVGMLSFGNVTAANLLGPLLGIGLFVATVWFLFKWVATGGFGFLGPIP